MPETTENAADEEENLLGTVYLPAGAGTGVGRFEFLVDVDLGQDVEIGTLVAADTDEGVIVGTVVDMRCVGTDTDPVRAESSRRPSRDRIGYLPEVMCAEVQVLAADKLRPVRAGTVRAATRSEVASATGMSRMEWPIPIGAIALADGELAPVSVDGTFVLGPEAQGLGVYGRSGVASKTSFMTVALRSALASGSDVAPHRVAAIVFNVKGEDLVWLDREPEESMALHDEDRELYAAMGLAATPFEDVEVWSTATLDGGPARSVRHDARMLRWDLLMVWKYLRFFLPNMYEDDKLSGFVAQFSDLLLRHPSAASRIDTFDKLEGWFRTEIDTAESVGSDHCWGGRLHMATARRLRRTFTGLRARGQGLFCGNTSSGSDDIPDSGWHHGQVLVVDLAGLSSEVQGFIIARTVDRLMESAEQGRLGVDHLAVVTDELNVFAASSGSELSQVRRTLQRVATQGRYAGLALFGAAQAASKIDDLLRDNSSTKALGSSAENELLGGPHGRLSSGLIERIATLPKGQMALWHTAFRQAIVVRFPRPAWKMGKSRTTAGTRPTATSVLGSHLSSGTLERLTAGLDAGHVEELAAGAGSVEAAVEALDAARDHTPRTVHAPRTFDRDDPYAID